MAERKNRSLVRRLLFGLLSLIGTAALMALAYLGSVLLLPERDAEDFRVQEEAAVTRLQAGDFTDARLLRDTFGAMLPVLPGETVKGEARNKEFADDIVRHAWMQFSNGAEITAVKPASASALLLKDGLDVSLRTDIQVLRVPAMLAKNGDEYCLYFDYDGAAYAFYAQGVTEEQFLNLAAALEKVQ